jgi:8-oxo-dGTP pyrophosphatase MutT (NUDIX family)
MVPTKSCPVVFRDSTLSRILVFKHPRAGIQLVKGTIEAGETPAIAALRELHEESGIFNAVVDRDLGLWISGFEGRIWSFQLCSTSQALPESWVHHTEDDGGLDLKFYWHPINQIPQQDCHPVFQRALRHILGVI